MKPCDVARRLKVSVSTVRRLADELEAERVGKKRQYRFKPSAVERYRERQRKDSFESAKLTTGEFNEP